MKIIKQIIIVFALCCYLVINFYALSAGVISITNYNNLSFELKIFLQKWYECIILILFLIPVILLSRYFITPASKNIKLNLDSIEPLQTNDKTDDSNFSCVINNGDIYQIIRIIIALLIINILILLIVTQGFTIFKIMDIFYVVIILICDYFLIKFYVNYCHKNYLLGINITLNNKVEFYTRKRTITLEIVDIESIMIDSIKKILIIQINSKNIILKNTKIENFLPILSIVIQKRDCIK